MHRRIDAFTDSNSFFRRSKSRLGERGYLKGVVIDIAYDYLLLKNWDTYSSIDKVSFLQAFYRDASIAITDYPSDAKLFAQRIIQSKILSHYSTIEGLLTTFERLDTRLSKRILSKDNTVSYFPSLKREIDDIEQDFLFFFPLMIDHFKQESGLQLDGHWFKQ